MGDITQLITELQIRMEVVEQTQDDINGYLDSLTADLDIVKTNQIALSSKLLSLEQLMPSIDQVSDLNSRIVALEKRVFENEES